MKRFIGILFAVSCVAIFASTASAVEFVRMVSGPAGGSWYPLGAKVMQVLGQEVAGISTSNAPGGGVGNIKDVGAKNAEIGWSYGHTAYNGYSGLGKFKRPVKNVRHFATLYPAAFQVAVRRDSPIRSFSDMRDKNISPGKAGWTGTAFAESILKAFGFDFATIKSNGGVVHYVDYGSSVALMKDRHIDVFMAVTSVPQASLISLNFSPGIRMIGLEPDMRRKIVKANPGFITATIPKSAYGFSEDIPTLGAVTVMVVNKDLSDKLVYQMAKAFWANHAKFAEVKKIWNSVKLENALNGAAIPVHPGAQRFYDEKGVK